jgi:ketosteroid isomerase-like protein
MSAKQIIDDLYRAYASRDRAAIRAMLHDDAVWVAPGGNATQVAVGHGTGDEAGSPGSPNRMDADEIARFMAVDFHRLFRDVGNQVGLVIAEGDIGVIEHRLSATLPNGRSYVNDYCFVIETREGRVSAIREYMDTRGGWKQVFGEGPGTALIS